MKDDVSNNTVIVSLIIFIVVLFVFSVLSRNLINNQNVILTRKVDSILMMMDTTHVADDVIKEFK